MPGRSRACSTRARPSCATCCAPRCAGWPRGRHNPPLTPPGRFSAMPTPQPGIFALGHRSQHHLQLDLEPGANPGDVREAIARIGDLSPIEFGVGLVIGFAADVYERIEPGA